MARIEVVHPALGAIVEVDEQSPLAARWGRYKKPTLKRAQPKEK